MIRAQYKLDPQRPHTQFQSNGVSVFLHFFWKLLGLLLPLEGQEALFLTVLSAAEETLMEEETHEPGAALLKAGGAVCAGPSGGPRPQRAAPRALPTYTHHFLIETCIHKLPENS